MGCHFFLQGTFPTQGLNPGFLQQQADSLPSEPPGKPTEQGNCSNPLRPFYPGDIVRSSSVVSGLSRWQRIHLPMQEMETTGVQSLGWGRSPGVGNGNPLQYSCLENSMGRAAWQATVYGVAKSQAWLSIAQQETGYQMILYKGSGVDLLGVTGSYARKCPFGEGIYVYL